MSQTNDNDAVVSMSTSARKPITKWTYNGNTFEFDVGDAEDASHFEDVMLHFGDAEKSLKKDGGISDQIIAYDKLFRDMFDEMFGEGAGDAILGERRSMNNCDDAYESFLEFISAQSAGFAERRAALLTKYNGNRAQRRSASFNRR